MPLYDTGHGSTIAFATSAFSAPFTMIGASEQSRAVLDKSHLGTTVYREKKPGDLVDPGTMDFEFFFDPAMDTLPPIAADPEVVTIDLDGAGAAGGILSGSAFFESMSLPELVTDQIMKSKGRICWADGPTWTDEP